MKKDTDYLVSHPKQIANHLTELMTKKCIISTQFGEHNLSFLTVIIEIDEKNKEIKLDCAPSEQLNRQLLTATKVLFRTEYEGIKVSFRGYKLRKISSDGLPALAMPLPDAIFWLQRREYYRVKIPMSHTGSFCRITLSLTDAAGEVSLEKLDFKLLDVGIRGFSILVADPAIYEKLLPNDEEQWQGSIHLHERTLGEISFVVKYQADVKTGPNAIQKRIGCMLTDIASTFESSLQVYMQDLERLLKK